MSQQTPEGWQTKAQIGVMVLTLLGTLGLSIWGKPAAPFAAVGLGVLLLLRLGDIASITLKGFGAEAAVTRAERATADANRATENAEKTIEALKQLGMHLSSVVLPLILSSSTRLEAAILQRNIAGDQLKIMGSSPKQIANTFAHFDFAATIKMITDTSSLLGFEHTVSDLHQALWPSEPVNVIHIENGFAYKFEDLKRFFGNYVSMTPELESWLREIDRYQKTGQIDFDKFRQLQKL